MTNEQLITDAKSIHSLFQSFRANKNIIILRYELQEFNAQIHRVNDYSITLFYRGKLPLNIENIEVSTSLRDTIYFAESKVLNIAQSEITLAIPPELEKGVKRKYPRVHTKDDVYLKFNVISNADDKFQGNNKGQKIPPQFVTICKELLQPIPDIKRIFPLLAQELKKKAPLFEIKLYKNEETNPKRVDILKRYKETIYIANVRDSKAYFKDHHGLEAISFLSYFNDLKNSGKPDQVIKNELIQAMKDDIASTAVSYICSPIILFSQVIGHIFLGITEGSYSVFRDQDIYFVKYACDIITEALAKAKLHQLDTGKDFDVPTIDLSAGGVLIEMNDPFILKYLTGDMKLRIVLKVNEREVTTIGKIIRIEINEEKNTEIAVKFTELRWNDQEYIDTYVNRKIGMEKMQQSQKK